LIADGVKDDTDALVLQMASSIEQVGGQLACLPLGMGPLWIETMVIIYPQNLFLYKVTTIFREASQSLYQITDI
jgi:hypothetical protein